MTAIAGIERFAFKGVASNLVTYLTDVVNLSNSSAAKMVNSWVGFTSIMVSSFLYFVVSHPPHTLYIYVFRKVSPLLMKFLYRLVIEQ